MPKITSSTLLQFSSDCRKRRVGLKRCYVGRFGRTNFRFKQQLATTSSNRVGDWRVLFNLLEARLSIVSQIYTSVLKTKVKLIEYAFETLPAWTLSMPPSKARKYIQTKNNVSGKLKGVPQLTKNTLTTQMHCCCFFFFHGVPLFSCLRKYVTESSKSCDVV